MKPLVALSMSRDNQSEGASRDFLRTTYVDAVIQAGAIPVLLPNVPVSVELLRRCDGLILTGGGDVDPAMFGAEDEGTQWAGVSRERDAAEHLFVQEAETLGMPVFGICRGIQVLAVAYGGTLIQDIPRRRPDSPIAHSQRARRQQPTHEVTVDESSRLAQILGETRIAVNSFHHQAIDRVPEGWRVVAQAPDQIVEAMEYPGDRLLFGVQWHPEDLVGDRVEAQRLFRAFVDACRAFQARKGEPWPTSP
ncbi:MAG: gamma-glutamyl-gamma-aminobutyrate hydrolase family protein [Firmicutes bacterium]|nr:gamma-glutamyl-gamma-aminobutyrate hydrolase family protein [Bacillota bacterium]